MLGGQPRRDKKDKFRSRMEDEREEEEIYSFPKKRKQELTPPAQSGNPFEQGDSSQLPLPRPPPPFPHRRPRRESDDDEEEEDDEDSQTMRRAKRSRLDGEMSQTASSSSSSSSSSCSSSHVHTSTSAVAPVRAQTLAQTLHARHVSDTALYAATSLPVTSKRWHDDEADYADVNKQLRDLHMERKSRQHFGFRTIRQTLPPDLPTAHAPMPALMRAHVSSPSPASVTVTSMQLSSAFPVVPVPPSVATTSYGEQHSTWKSDVISHSKIQGGMQDRYAREYERIRLEEEREEREAEEKEKEKARAGRN